MGVANELIAVSWGYAGRRIKSTEMLKLNNSKIGLLKGITSRAREQFSCLGCLNTV
jgi:hypothetical protein